MTVNRHINGKSDLSILVVEDDPDVMEQMEDTLEMDVHTVFTATDGNEGLEVFLCKQPDVIITDIKMPHCDGLEMIRKIRKTDTQVPIIVTTAYHEEHYLIAAIELGVTRFLFKPIIYKQFQNILDEIALNLALVCEKERQEEELHQALSHLRNTKAELEEFNRRIINMYGQQDQFLKTLVHEISTPVSVIALNSDSLIQKTEKNTHLAMIKASVKVLSDIYDDLYYLMNRSKKHSEPVAININHYLKERIDYFNEVISMKNIVVEIITHQDITLNFPQTAMQRLIDNLLSNAVKYSNENGLIEITTEMGTHAPIITIQDSGIGIKEVDKIFQSQYREETAQIGLGIGLSTVKGICDSHRIDIAVESEQGKGACFQLTFPADSLISCQQL